MRASSRLLRALAILVAFAIVVVSAGDADAKKKRKRDRDRDRVSQKAKKRNMPPGWSWPPSRAMRQVGDDCLAQLDTLGLEWKKGKKSRKVATPVVVPNMEFGGVAFKPTFRKPPFTMDCHLAVGLANYGKGLYALGVRTVKFSSIYRYDHVTVNGHKKRTLSRHALGLAVDIRSFVDAAGNEARVLEDYPTGNELLLNIEQYLNDTGGFRTVLTPRNDPESHDDHFHVEIKVDYSAPSGRRKPNS